LTIADADYSLCGMQHALTKQRKLCTSIHHAFDELEFRDLSFDLPIALCSDEGRFHSRSITLNALGKLAKLSDGTRLGFSQPGGKCVYVSLSQYLDEVLGQIQSACHFSMKQVNA
jgi:hypothetical protein